MPVVFKKKDNGGTDDTKPVMSIEHKPAVATLSHTIKQNNKVVAEDSETEVVGHLPFTGPVCHVGVEASSTINLGNFNSIKVGVSVNIPCVFNEIEKTYETAQEWVNNKMEALQEQVNSAGS